MPHTDPFFPDYDGQRRWRTKHYAKYNPLKIKSNRRAVVTIVKNESVFFPIWLQYYSKFFAPEDIYVLDHETSDDSLDKGGFHRLPVFHPSFDIGWMTQTIQRFEEQLFKSYDVVLYCDCDEIIAPDPTLHTLGEYLDRFDEQFVSCMGYELLHQTAKEPAIDLSKPILDQRGFWFRNPIYDKPILSSEPMEWVSGFHRRKDQLNNYDPDLYLIHLRRMDFNICWDRNKLRAKNAACEEEQAKGWGAHGLIVDAKLFTQWFCTDSNLPGFPIQIEPIPSHWRGTF